MKNSMSISLESAQSSRVSDVLMLVLSYLVLPIQWLQAYYTRCINEANLENGDEVVIIVRKISMRKTLHLLHIQVAFLFAVFANPASFILQVLLIIWFIAVLLCRVE